MPVLEQSAFNTTPKWATRWCTATFTTPTKPGSLIVITCAAAGTLPSRLWLSAAGFTEVSDLGLRDIQMSVWYRQNAPSMTSATVFALDDNKSLQVRMLEYSGVALSNALDRVRVATGESDDPRTGTSQTTSQPDELVLAFLTNQYAPTTQSGFTGNLTKLYETVSPQNWWGGSNEDWERSRLSVHQAIATSTGTFSLSAHLSTDRRWLATLVTFRGASTGPARFTSQQQTTPMLTTGGTGSLTVFGPLSSVLSAADSPMLRTAGSGWIGPSNYQYRLGGPSGLLIGSGTNFHVQSTDGLGGWTARTSDDDLPRSDGALRGIDLQSARQVQFKVNVGRGRDDVERHVDELLRALVPRRDADWELIWRHPTQPLKMMRVRPIDLPRQRNNGQIHYAAQTFTLRAADPRHYSAVEHVVEVPISSGTGDPEAVEVTNLGSVAAYPLIEIFGPTSGPPVSRVTVTNQSALVAFDVKLTLQAGSVLTGDMDALVTGAPRSIVTLDGQSKYGAWQLPRDPFRIDADPAGHGGFNMIYARTVPDGAPVRVRLTYRDTWSG